MIYDLNLHWSPTTTDDKLLQTLTAAASLGYGTVAINHILELPFPANPKAPFPTFPEAVSKTLPKILHRATLPLSDPSASNYRIPSLMNAYDILAIRPLTEKAFQNACLTMDVPIISLDLTQHFPFHFRPKPCMAAVSRGVRFEICYAQILNADARGRANFISNITNLFRATRGRGMMISSEAKTALGLRGPADIVNLFNVWGLANDKGMEALRAVPRSVVVNEGIKRNGFRGIVNVVQVTSNPPPELKKSTDGEAQKEKKGIKRKQNRQNGPLTVNQSKKPKRDDP
ncbi:hypothetical protein VHEMI04823 [[Torrubiella] hemipterigena]|uniref:RNase P subunit p30 n=1 Tax=[Torrubiella] hemipterigena TaxID=1531966 RepID=A0A0A1TH72_9HYPO|nr:hypothetical protein VHEMI04823 [[Torrubiella] hemipterigena]